MAETSDTGAARRAAILEAATDVFVRYGLKKTSMDDLARAAGLSRQGLYLHFATKEALFQAVVLHVTTTARAASRAALSREDQGVEERIAGAFGAVHGHGAGQPWSEHMSELLEAAKSLVGPRVAEMEEELVADVARLLRSSGVAARWKEAGLSAKDLAEHLHAVSLGMKHGASTMAEYHERLRVAARLVCRGKVG